MAALITVATTVIQVVIFVCWPPLSFHPAPGDVAAWFALLQVNPIRGLLDLDLLMVVDYVFLLIVFLALYTALRRTSPALASIGMSLALVGIVLYFTTNSALAMLSLSQQHAAAATEAQRTACLAAGQAIMAMSQGTSFDVSYLLMGAAGITISAAMLRSALFGRATAVVGILQGALMLVPSNAGKIGLVFSLASLLPFSVWFVLVGRRLLRLSRGTFL